MKKHLSIKTKDSGIRLLRNISLIILLIGVFISGIMEYFALTKIGGEVIDALIPIPFLLGSIFLYGLGLCIASIAESCLYLKSHIENQYKDED